MTDSVFDIRIAVDDRMLVDIRNFPVEHNRITFLFGESGIGKTLIARTIYGLLDPLEFEIAVNGDPYDSYVSRTETMAIRENGFFVFQEPSSHLNPLLSLNEQIHEGSLGAVNGNGDVLKELWEGSDDVAIRKLLDVFPKPYRPSGGEKQRMFLAMALKKMDSVLARGNVRNAFFVFDEPSGNLDNRFRNVFLSLLFKRLQRKPLTVLFITHDYSMISEITHRYSAFADRMCFKELGLNGGELTVREFQPSTYLGWLASQRKKAPAKSSETLLRVESGVETFGFRLAISKRNPETHECPLELHAGTIVYLKAPSGTGKTTIVKAIMGLVPAQRLRCTVGEMSMSESTPVTFWRRNIWGKKMTLVFQHADEALNPEATVMETLSTLPTTKRMSKDEIRRRMSDLFDEDTSTEIADKKVKALSGGQKQRLNLLRGFLLDTGIIILDEPLNGLDFESTTRVLEMIRRKQEAGCGILIISHNEEIFEAIVPEDNIYTLRSTLV